MCVSIQTNFPISIHSPKIRINGTKHMAKIRRREEKLANKFRLITCEREQEKPKCCNSKCFAHPMNIERTIFYKWWNGSLSYFESLFTITRSRTNAIYFRTFHSSVCAESKKNQKKTPDTFDSIANIECNAWEARTHTHTRNARNARLAEWHEKQHTQKEKEV